MEPGELCLANPSFEGVAQFNAFVFEAPPWSSCGATTPDIWNETQAGLLGVAGAGVKASDGSTYLTMYSLANDYQEAASEPLCAALTAGKTYSLELDLMFDSVAGPIPAEATSVELFAGNTSCATDQLLWRSPIAAASWQTHCFTFTAEQAFTHLTVRSPPTAMNTTGVFADHLVPVSRCE
jgi:hypothetical protein